MGPLTNLWNAMVNRFTDEQTWEAIGLGTIKIIAIVIIAGLAVRVGKTIIQNVFKVRSRAPLQFSERRETTLLKLLQNVLSYVVYFAALLAVLSTLSFDVRGLLAGAGILGLAVGFGAQNLVRDIITGFFIIFEDQFSVGDYVRIGQAEGHVEEIGLRTTKIKSWTGELHIFPNGSIMEVTNFSIHNSVAFVDVSVAYEEDIERVERVINELLDVLPEKYEDIVMRPELLGVQTLGASDVVMRVTAETTPMRHFYISRMLRKEIKNHLDANGIEIPFPRMVMYSRQEEAQNTAERQKNKSRY